MLKTALLAALVGLSLVACSKKEDGAAASTSSGAAASTAKIGACNKLSNAGKCTQYSLTDDLTTTMQKGACEATSGTWQTTACPAEKQFANCATNDSKIFFYSGTQAPGSGFTMSEEFAKTDCEMMSGKLTVTAKAAEPAAAPKDPLADAAEVAGSCDYGKEDGKCTEYFQLALGDTDKDFCQRMNGKWAAGKACPKEGRASVCRTDTQRTIYWKKAFELSGPKEMAKLCTDTMMGQWGDFPAAAPAKKK